MKKYIVISLLLFFFSSGFAQIELIRVENKIKSKIKIGMSADEVKQALGRPKDVKPGFPDGQKQIVESLPDQSGQMNYSTWFYTFPKSILRITITEPTKYYYKVNGVNTTKDIYDCYQNRDSVFFIGGAVSYPDNDYRNHIGFVIEKKDSASTWFRGVPGERNKKIFLPVFAVIFDKGTQVVSDMNVFFLDE